jgi:GntR family transcriptional regulator
MNLPGRGCVPGGVAEEPRNRQIARELRLLIENGTFGPGALLPSEPELARSHGVSRQTARSALQTLEQEGLAIVRPRRGRTVRSSTRLVWRLSGFTRPGSTGLASWDAWETDLAEQGHAPTRQDPTVETVSPPREIATRLGLDPGRDLCTVRRHVRHLDGKPGIVTDDYFREEPAAGTGLATPGEAAGAQARKRSGREPAYHVDEIITRMPAPDEARRLSLGTGQPVAEHTRTTYAADDQPIQVSVSVIPGDLLILRYVIPA